MTAGAAGPWLNSMADSGGEPTDGPKASGAARQQRMTLMTELCPKEYAFPPATLAEEFTVHLSHGRGSG